jgi:hypothetical protein
VKERNFPQGACCGDHFASINPNGFNPSIKKQFFVKIKTESGKGRPCSLSLLAVYNRQFLY